MTSWRGFQLGTLNTDKFADPAPTDYHRPSFHHRDWHATNTYASTPEKNPFCEPLCLNEIQNQIHDSRNSSNHCWTFVDRALAIIRSLPAPGFENLCQRLLRESGFEEVNVTGRSGDGGIDGEGILKVNPFVSFRVLFQCKRYKDSVGPSTIRDFRGAMAGRAEKGIILTTGYFTSQAESEASRDGAQPIQLVDGEALIQLLGDLELGLQPVKSYEIHERFFDQFRKSRDGA